MEKGDVCSWATIKEEIVEDGVKRYTFCGKKIRVQVINIGCTITRLETPDKNGEWKDIVLGYKDESYYKNNKAYFGCVVGRCANRIANGSFSIEGKAYKLDCNNGPNHLHGGASGYHQKLWNSEIQGNAVVFSLKTLEEEEPYPGKMEVTVVYRVMDMPHSQIMIEYLASPSEPTPINLTNHSYFNLAGHDSGTICGHAVKISADSYLPVNDNMIPIGEMRNVEKDKEVPAMNLLEGRKMTAELLKSIPGGGYDHNYCLQHSPQVEIGSNRRGHYAAKVEHEKSGRVLEVFTEMPGVQFYSGNFLNSSDDRCQNGKDDCIYDRHGGFCLETQFCPDAINNKLDNCIFSPDSGKYDFLTIFRFGINSI